MLLKHLEVRFPTSPLRAVHWQTRGHLLAPDTTSFPLLFPDAMLHLKTNKKKQNGEQNYFLHVKVFAGKLQGDNVIPERGE